VTERPGGRAEKVFGRPRPVVGMVHLLPLPGSPRWQGSMDQVLGRAEEDARALLEGGVDGLLVENFGDVPFHPGAVPPETVAALARAVVRVREVVEGLRSRTEPGRRRGPADPAGPGGRARPIPVGLNVLRNDARAGVGIAAAAGAAFLRVNVHTGSMFTDQGLLEGRAHETLRERARLVPHLLLLADVHVKHATPPIGESLEAAARDAVHRGLADILVVSGSGTGEATDPERIRRVREAVPGVPVWVGSGVTADTVGRILGEPEGTGAGEAESDGGSGAHGVIVGSALHRDGVVGRGIDPARVREVVAAARTPGA
jgi:uncharacterized protein